MVIKGLQLTYDDYLPQNVVIYLRKRMQSLAIKLQRKLGKNYNVSLSFSKKSEAGYFIITPVFDYVDVFNGYNKLVISIRNHHQGRTSNYDVSIFMCDFDSWDDLRKFILNSCIGYIKSFDREGLNDICNGCMAKAN